MAEWTVTQTVEWVGLALAILLPSGVVEQVQAFVREDEIGGEELEELGPKRLQKDLKKAGVTDPAGVTQVLLEQRDAVLSQQQATIKDDSGSAVSVEPMKPPPEYVCPLSLELMTDPVLTSNGQCYDRAFIQKWLRQKQVDPITNNKLRDKKLTPNIPLRKMIQDWMDKNPQ